MVTDFLCKHEKFFWWYVYDKTVSLENFIFHADVKN